MTEYFLVLEGDEVAPFCDRVVTMFSVFFVFFTPARVCGGAPKESDGTLSTIHGDEIFASTANLREVCGISLVSPPRSTVWGNEFRSPTSLRISEHQCAPSSRVLVLQCSGLFSAGHAAALFFLISS